MIKIESFGYFQQISLLKINPENAVKSGIIKKSQKDELLKELTFDFDKQGLTRERVI